jgi:S-methylmethionine-dependent homocysteine/selenocysteine methylase
MSADEAERYHYAQARALAEAGADLITAMTITYPGEACGIVRAAARCGLPAVIGFTTETDGRLPDGTRLEQAIDIVDREADGGPAYYMINCAHPEHFSEALTDEQPWTTRIRALRANASRCSHAELDEASELDDGDPVEFAELHRQLRVRFPHISVVGGCCGTDHRHVGAVGAALLN